MKNVFAIAVVAVTGLFIASCQKCHTCYNQREVCRKARYDTTLTILVSSQVLTKQYYLEYIDSLTSPSLGWVCYDTTSDYSEQYCESGFSNTGLYNEQAKGLVCTQ